MDGQDGTIKVYCTVDPRSLERRGDTCFCHKCARVLVNADKAARPDRASAKGAGKMLCGFVSAVVLNSCAQQGGEIPLPGIYYCPDDVDSAKEEVSVALAAPDRDGVVISPFGGHLVDVSHLPAGALAIDPVHGPESRKFFRIPE